MNVNSGNEGEGDRRTREQVFEALLAAWRVEKTLGFAETC